MKIIRTCMAGFLLAASIASGQHSRVSEESSALSRWYEEVSRGSKNVFFPEKTWERYLEEKDQLERWLTSPRADWGGVAVLATLARAAVLLEKAEAADLIERALADHDQVSKASPGERTGISDLIRPLQIALIDRGDLALASEVNDRLLQREKEAGDDHRGSRYMYYDTSVYEALGDFEAAETSLKSKLGWQDPLLQHADATYRDMQTGMRALPYLKLARAQAALGKEREARESLDQAAASVAAYQRCLDNLHVTMADSTQAPLENIFAHYYFSLGSETWLRLDEPALALQLADEGARLGSFEMHDKRPEEERALDNSHMAEWHSLTIYTLRGKALLGLGRYAEAEQAWQALFQRLEAPDLISKRPVPSFHPDLIAARQGLAWSLLGQGKREEAANEALAVSQAQEELITNLFGYASERQRLSFLQSADLYSLLAETGQVDRLAEVVTRFKGAVLDSVLEDRRNAAKSTSPEAVELLRELRVARRLAINASLSGTEDEGDWATKAGQLEARLGALTQSQGEVRQNLEVEVDQIRSALRDSDALCDFVRYQHAIPSGGKEPHYGVLVLRRDEPTEWVRLGDAATIDAAISRLNKGISGFLDLSEEELAKDLRFLHDRLIAPTRSALEGSTRLIVSPDGDLSCLSFAVLLDENEKFIAERWDLGFVSAARDLLEETNLLPEEIRLTVFADPDFSSSSGTPEPPQKFRSISVSHSLAFPEITPLPGTKKEMEALSAFGETVGWDVEAFSGTNASESRAALLSAPTILHFATHGFFLEAQDAVTEAGKHQVGLSSARVDDPLQRSFLALAGAQNTFEQWARLEAPDAGSDGILNAVEISLLDLDNTWLATLSACDTARGESLEGEGVLGLRRGFFLAGVDHLLMTFWPIADEETVALMEAFYRELSGSGHPALALSKVQREALVRFREERGLFGAVALAGPFAVSFSGTLPGPN